MAAVPLDPGSGLAQRTRQAQFRFTDEQRTEILAAYEAGATMAALATRYGVKRESVSKLLRRSGVMLRTQRQFSDADLRQATRMYEQGMSSAAIAERLGWNQATIWRRLKQSGVQMRSPNDR